MKLKEKCPLNQNDFDFSLIFFSIDDMTLFFMLYQMLDCSIFTYKIKDYNEKIIVNNL